MCLTESAVLLGLHPVGMSLFVFRHVVIALLALRTCQGNSRAHDFHLHFHRSLTVFSSALIFAFCHAVGRPIPFGMPAAMTSRKISAKKKTSVLPFAPS